MLLKICAKFGIPYSSQAPNIEQNSDGVISDFRILGQSLIKKIVITPEPVMILIRKLDQ